MQAASVEAALASELTAARLLDFWHYIVAKGYELLDDRCFVIEFQSSAALLRSLRRQATAQDKTLVHRWTPQRLRLSFPQGADVLAEFDRRPDDILVAAAVRSGETLDVLAASCLHRGP